MTHNKKERELLANFLQIPTPEDPKMHSLPEEFSRVIDRAWENWGIGNEVSPEHRISENWQKLVGTALSGKCAPEKINSKNGTLFIRTSSGPIKQELSFLKPKILAKIRKLEGCSKIREIKIF